jgi:hypothetical protein
MENKLIFLEFPFVTIATNTFIGVPIILRYEEENLMEITKSETVGFTTKIPIYHSDGTYLAVAMETDYTKLKMVKKLV